MALRCSGPHKGPIQEFTEICLACDHNIHETDEEYEQFLAKELTRARDESQRKQRADHIADMEAELRRHGRG